MLRLLSHRDAELKEAKAEIQKLKAENAALKLRLSRTWK
jgi:hypothetical protein